MSTYSKFLELVNGVARTIDLSANTLQVQALEVGTTLLSQTGAYSSFTGTIPGTSTSVTITANNPGAAGNSIALVFNGSTTIAAQIAAWNLAHSNNMATLTSGSGSQTPTAGTTTLTSGVDAGSSLIGDTATYNFFTPTAPTVMGALAGIDNALANLSTSAITSLTGDGTASGPGAAAFTLATVNLNVGSFGSSTSIPTFTVNAKGLITAASGNAVVAPAGTLTGSTLASNVLSSSLTSVGTITSGTWNGTTIAIANGGTGQTSAAAAFNALAPATATGGLILGTGTNTYGNLAIGTSGYVLTSNGSTASWVAPATSGTVTSVGLADGSSTPIYTISNSPVTSTGNLTFTLNTQSANKVFAGPSSGSAAQPGFRSLVSADIPDLSATYVTQTEVGSANGVASLDGSGKVPLSQLPSSVMEYKGAWDASTNTPTLADGTGTAGWVYRVSVAGTQNLGSGSQSYYVGDFVIYNGTIWQRSPLADGVVSVNGATGAVTVNAINQLTGDVTTSAATQSQSEAATIAAIQGNTVTGTTGTGNVVFSASPTLTGTITAAAANFSGAISASNFSGSSSGTNTGDQTITLTGDVTGSGTGSFATTIAANAVTTSKINNAAVTAAKLGAVTDGITTDQNGAGSTIEVLSSPKNATSEISDQALSASTLYALRYERTTDGGGTAGHMWKADNDTTTNDNFYVIGLAYPAGAVSAGGAVTVTEEGYINVPSHGFTPGLPLYLGASGACTTTAPTATLSAVVKVGMVKDANNIMVQVQTMGIN